MIRKNLRTVGIIFLALLLIVLAALAWVLHADVVKKMELQKAAEQRIVAPPFAANPQPGYPYFYELQPGSEREDIEGVIRSAASGNIINNDGLNQVENYSVSKPANTFRIVILGDSQAFGLGLDSRYDFASDVQQLLDTSPNSCGETFQVLNLGVAGYDFSYEAEHFLLHGEKYSPDLIVWEVTRAPLQESTDSERAYDALQATINESHCTSAQCASMQASADAAFFQQMASAPSPITLDNNAFNSVARVYKGPILFFNYIYMESFFLGYLTNLTHSRPNTYLAPWPAGTETFLDPQTDLLDNGHPNKEGSAKVAADLFQNLKKVIPCLAAP